jgi:hypothetical protein
MEAIVHEFPKTSCAPACKALAVRHGLVMLPVALYEGRQCCVISDTRISRRSQYRSAYNSLTVQFLDDGSLQQIPAGRFAQKAKSPPLPQD